MKKTQINDKYEGNIDVDVYVAKRLDGNDYGFGAVEGAARSASNTIDAFSNLIQLLADKGILDDNDIIDVLRGIY